MVGASPDLVSPVLGTLALGVAALSSIPGAAADRDSAVQTELADAWRDYRRVYIRASGRVVDIRGGRISTSEGQAYGMLRAVWADDRESFERMLKWTLKNLQNGDPTALPAWKWGRREGAMGRGVVDPQPAADADQFMAYALLMAAERWGDRSYRRQARGLLNQIWDAEVQDVGPYRVVLPGPWAASMDPVQLNPSYALPFAWRAFAVADPAHPWLDLVDDFYALMAAVSGDDGALLAPDWLWLRRDDGVAVPPPEVAAHDHHGFEAFRLAWALAADAIWYAEPRALSSLAPYTALEARWAAQGWIPAVMDRHGEARVEYPYLGLYGALVPAWGIRKADLAEALYQAEVAPNRSPWGWGDRADYYTQNWTWLGLALWCGAARPPEMYR